MVRAEGAGQDGSEVSVSYASEGFITTYKLFHVKAFRDELVGHLDRRGGWSSCSNWLNYGPHGNATGRRIMAGGGERARRELDEDD